MACDSMYVQPSFLTMHGAEVYHDAVPVQGPKQPGNNIDVYLRLLVDELLLLFKKGVRVWDEYK
jgi:hypothetical protein